MAGTKDAVKAVTVFRSLDLAAVAVGDGGDDIGEDHAALEQSDGAVKLQGLHTIKLRRQAEKFQQRRRKVPLIAEIVDGEEGAGGGEAGVVTKDGAEKDRQESALPVIAVNDIRDKIEPLAEFQRRVAEEAEAFGVVGKVAGRRTIEAVTIEVTGMIKEIDGNPSYLPLPHVRLLDKTPDRHLDADAGDGQGKA